MIKLSHRDKFADGKPQIIVTKEDTLDDLWSKIKATPLYKEKSTEMNNHISSYSDSAIRRKQDLMERASYFFDFIDEEGNAEEEQNRNEILPKIEKLKKEIFESPNVASEETMTKIKELRTLYNSLAHYKGISYEEITESLKKLNYWLSGKLKGRVVKQTERVSQPSFVQILRTITSKGVTAEVGSKGQIIWEGEDKYNKINVEDENGTVTNQPAKLFLVTLGEKYSKAKDGKVYVKGNEKVYVSEIDVISTKLPGDYYVQKEWEETDRGDWDDRQKPGESNEAYYQRLRSRNRWSKPGEFRRRY